MDKITKTGVIVEKLNYADATKQYELLRHNVKGELVLRVQKVSHGKKTLRHNRHKQLCWGIGVWLEMPSVITGFDSEGIPMFEIDYERLYASEDNSPILTPEEESETDWYIEAYDLWDDF